MLIPLLAATLLTTRASAAADDDVCVEVLPTGVRNAKITLGAPTELDLVLSVERTCGWTVRLRRLDYVVTVNDSELASRSVDYDGLKLPVGEPIEVVVPVTLNAGVAAGALMSAFSGGELQLSLSGEAAVRWFIIPYSLGFDEQLIDVGL